MCAMGLGFRFSKDCAGLRRTAQDMAAVNDYDSVGKSVVVAIRYADKVAFSFKHREMVGASDMANSYSACAQTRKVYGDLNGR